jgi:hypothetical protein
LVQAMAGQLTPLEGDAPDSRRIIAQHPDLGQSHRQY